MMQAITLLACILAQAAAYRSLSMTHQTPVSPKNQFDIKKPVLGLFTAFSTALLVNNKPAHAFSQQDANQLLSSYELPPILYIPPGFAPLVSEFGRGNIKKGLDKQNPILVQYCHPSLWVVQKTSVNNNGESGTIGANDYIKGDSSFLYVAPDGFVSDNELPLTVTSKKLVEKILLKCKLYCNLSG
jgi:hypothetical protein